MPIEQYPRRTSTPPPRYVPAPAADAATTTRIAAIVIQAGAFATVLAALPYPIFQLDRYTYPKELVLGVAALAAALLCLASARRLSIFMVDALLAAFLAVSAVSALFATNGWLAFRALGVSLAGAALFWSARTIARSGRREALLMGLAIAVVLGAVTGLVQAYGLVETSLASLSRAPGGTFGNRNFMAHLVAVGLPVLLYVSVESRSRVGFGLGAAGLALGAAALVLSRSRAAWLGAGACGVFLAVEGLWMGRLWIEERLRRRVVSLATVAAASLVLALLVPNRLNWRSDSPYLESLTGVANYKEGSGRGRLIQWENSLTMATRHPLLGVGPGNWPVHYPRYRSKGDPSFDGDDIIPTNPWPSSDWMAMLSERGFPAFVLLALVGGSIALGAWARVRRGSRQTPALTDLTIVATLLAIGVVGAFDAVLLLPAPTLFAWTIIGALASSARPVRELSLTPPVRRRVMVSVAIVGAAFLTRSAAQTIAMGVFGDGRRASMETAAAIDPGSYRIHMLLGRSWARAGRCDRALPHATAARELFPYHPAPQQLLRACGMRARR
ncbi:MAG TPA: O-antigen ligase family protein [Gemmatimonadales bacterium]|nr:O-antigen ligase family protein [Gemmatimonadales bacterium]